MGKVSIIDRPSPDIDNCRNIPWGPWFDEWSPGGRRSRQAIVHASSGFDLANQRQSEQEIEAIRRELDDFKSQYEPLLKDLKAKHDKFEQNRIRIEGLMKAGKASKRSHVRKGGKKRRPYESLADFESIMEELG